MKNITLTKKIDHKKQVMKSVNNLDFWKRIALEQQIIIHAKNRT